MNGEDPQINHCRFIPPSSCDCFAAVLGGQAVSVGRKMDLWSVQI